MAHEGRNFGWRAAAAARLFTELQNEKSHLLTGKFVMFAGNERTHGAEPFSFDAQTSPQR